MDIAKLQLQLETTDATKQADLFDQKLRQIGASLTNLETTGQRVMRSLQIAFQGSSASLQGLNVTMASSITGLNQLNAATRTVTVNMGTGTGGGGGTGLSGATFSAATAINSLTNNLRSLVVGYVGFRSAIRLGEDIIQTRVEFDRLDFGLKAITGSWGAARQEAMFLGAETDRLGLVTSQVIPTFIKMQAAFTSSGFTAREAEQIFSNMSVATKALGITGATTNRILYDMQEMASLGTVQMRQFRAMIMQMPGAFEAAAKAMHVTTAELHQMIHAGQVTAQEMLLPMTENLAHSLGSGLNEATQNLESNLNRMTNAWQKLMLEFSKTPVIKNSIQFIAGELDEIAIKHQLRNQPGAGAFQSERTLLNMMFPDARKAGTVQEDLKDKSVLGLYSYKGPSQDPDVAKTFKRMRDEQVLYNQIRNDWVQNSKDKPEELPSEHELDALEKLRILSQQYEIEKLTGLDKELAKIDLAAEKQIDSVDKSLAFIKDPDKRMYARDDIYSKIYGGADAEKGVLLRDAASKRETAQAVELTKAYTDLHGIEAKLTDDAAGDNYQQSLARINEQYRVMYSHLLELDEVINVPESVFAKLKAGKEAEILNLRPTHYYDFAGQNDLMGLAKDQQNQNYATPVTDEKSAREFQTGADRIQQIHQEMVRRMKSNTMDFTESFKTGFQGVVDSWGTNAEKIASIGETLGQSLDSNLTNGFTNAIFKTQDFAGAVTQMTQSVVQDLFKIAFEQFIIRQALSGISSLGMFGGGGGGLSNSQLSAGAAALGGTHHIGGVIGGFHAAPRFHGGGLVGDEMPIVARQGEVYFTPEQMNVLGKTLSGSQSKRPIHIINVQNDRMVEEALASNPDAILNILGRHAKDIKQMVANA